MGILCRGDELQSSCFIICLWKWSYAMQKERDGRDGVDGLYAHQPLPPFSFFLGYRRM